MKKGYKESKRHKEKTMFGRLEDNFRSFNYIRNKRIPVNGFCLFLGMQRYAANNHAE